MNHDLTLLQIAIKRVTGSILAICTAVCFTCTLDIPNSAYKDFEGIYGLEIGFDSLPDTLYVFRTYSLACADTGKDKFERIAVSTAPAGNADTSIPASLPEADRIALRFIDVFTGTLIIEGVRPNLKRLRYETPVVVERGFAITLDSSSLTGNGARFIIVAAAEGGTLDSTLSVIWYINNTKADSLRMPQHFSVPQSLGNRFFITARIGDRKGNVVQLDTLDIVLQTTQLPVVMIHETLLQAPVGKPFTISATAVNADSLRWRSSSLAKDTVTAAFQIDWVWPDMGVDTVIVTAKNRFGAYGSSDTVVVTPRNYIFDLSVVSFPSTVNARTWATWEVKAIRNGQPVSASEVTYIWSCSPDSVWDSIRTIGGRQELYIANETQFFTLGVVAVIGIDSTWRKSTTVTIRADKPVVTIAAYPPQVALNTELSLYVRAHDTNSGGAVTAIRYKTSENPTVKTLIGDTLRARFAMPGMQTVAVWCVDNEGFTSDTALAVLLVTSSKPYFERLRADTTVYINDHFSIDARAFAGNAADSVVNWKWDLDNNGTWDRTTSVGRLDTAYAIAGEKTVRIWCANSRGDSAETLAVREFVVLAGEPVVDSALWDKTTIYLNRSVVLRILAHDTNGIVKSLAVSWGSAQNALTIATNKARVDTAVQLSFATAGTYKFTIVATDEDGQVSATYNVNDSLIVDQGNPRVKSIRGDSAWYRTDTAFVINAEDNGNIAGYAVSFDNVTYSPWNTDSVFRHTFTDSGVQYVYTKVKDEDGNVSPVFKDSVFVKAGYPGITGVTLSVNEDSLFVLDSRGYTITATDPNKTVRKAYVNWNGGSAAQDSADVNGAMVSTTINHTYAIADSGSRSVKIWCRDEDGLLSTVATKFVRVRVGRPVVSAISRDSAKVFIGDPVRFTLSATDTNGTIAKALADWNGDGTADDSVTVLGTNPIQFTHTFSTAFVGQRTIRYWVHDDDDLMSNVFTDTVTVRLGKPWAVPITPDSSIFINDARQFAIATYDTNGTVDSIKVDNGSGTYSGFTKITNGAYTLNRIFTRSEAGIRIIRVIAKDNDGVLSDTASLQVTVQLGAPQIDSIRITNIIGKDFFVRDNNTFRVYVSDPNGTPKKIFAAWTGGPSPDDSIAITIGSSGYGDISHLYDTSLAGNQMVKFWVADEDTIRSVNSKDTTILVRKCSPVLSGDIGDSLFVVVNNGVGGVPYNIHINSQDTNGIIVRYYWDERTTLDTANLAASKKTNDSLFSRDFSAADLVIPFKMHIYGKDDDGLFRGNQFIVVADSAPPKPDIVPDKNGTTVTFAWSGKDARDGDATQYRVLLKAGSEPALTDVLVDFRAGSTFISGSAYSKDYRYDFTPPQSGQSYHFKIVARDARGSISISNDGTIFY